MLRFKLRFIHFSRQRGRLYYAILLVTLIYLVASLVFFNLSGSGLNIYEYKILMLIPPAPRAKKNSSCQHKYMIGFMLSATNICGCS